jgi:putative ABC transport system permease protein
MPNPLFTTSVSVGFETLRANPLRTILSTLGIVIGVAALVAVLSVGDGMERLARDQIGRTTDLQRLSVAPRTVRIVDRTPIPVANPAELTLADGLALRAAAAGVGTVNVMRSAAVIVTAQHDTTAHAAQVNGVLDIGAVLPDSLLLGGRPITTTEAAAGAPLVVISYRLARDFSGARPVTEVVGDTLMFAGVPRRVVGVLAADIAGERLAVMPFGALPVPVGTSSHSARLLVTAFTVEGVAQARQAIETWAASRYGASWNDRISILSDESRLAQVRKALFVFKLFMGALMSVSLVVGGLGIMNVLLSSVIERTREIGIRKASGAAQKHILWQFLCESVAITGVGSLIGLFLGVGSAFLITAIMRHMAQAPIQAWLSVSTVLVAIGASAAVGLAFGLYPALRAARLSPIDAIHHE